MRPSSISPIRTLGDCALDRALTSLSLWHTKPSPDRLPSILSFVQFSDANTASDPTHLLPQLLDHLALLGDLARQISQGLGGNGHRAEAVAEILKSLGGNDERQAKSEAKKQNRGKIPH